MNAILITGKKGKNKAHSNWTLMQSFLNDDGTAQLTFADKHSDDQIWFELEAKDIKRIIESLSKKSEP